MQIARDRYHDELSRNWVSIIAWTAITAVLPAGIPLPQSASYRDYPQPSPYATCHDDRKAGQKHHWMKYTLFMQKGIHDNRRNPLLTKTCKKPSNGTKPTASDNLPPSQQNRPGALERATGGFPYSSRDVCGLPPDPAAGTRRVPPVDGLRRPAARRQSAHPAPAGL